jgi:hypothetical protein
VKAESNTCSRNKPIAISNVSMPPCGTS